MRIVAEFSRSSLLVTIFQYEGKYSVSFKKGLYEQVYKFRDGQLQNKENATAWVSEEMCEQVNKLFHDMHLNSVKALSDITPNDDDDFEDII